MLAIDYVQVRRFRKRTIKALLILNIEKINIFKVQMHHFGGNRPYDSLIKSDTPDVQTSLLLNLLYNYMYIK